MYMYFKGNFSLSCLQLVRNRTKNRWRTQKYTKFNNIIFFLAKCKIALQFRKKNSSELFGSVPNSDEQQRIRRWSQLGARTKIFAIFNHKIMVWFYILCFVACLKCDVLCFQHKENKKKRETFFTFASNCLFLFNWLCLQHRTRRDRRSWASAASSSGPSVAASPTAKRSRKEFFKGG